MTANQERFLLFYVDLNACVFKNKSILYGIKKLLHYSDICAARLYIPHILHLAYLVCNWEPGVR